jgi:hypothetical protein
LGGSACWRRRSATAIYKWSATAIAAGGIQHFRISYIIVMRSSILLLDIVIQIVFVNDQL